MSSGSRAFKLDGPVRAANWGTFEHEKPKEASQFFAKCVMTEGESKKSFSIGDVVECVSLPPKKPYLGFVEAFWVDKADRCKMRTRWFYRAEDIPEAIRKKANVVNSREVFLAPDHNDNSVDKLISRAKLEVVKPGEASTQRGIEFCAREYDSIHQVVTPLSKAFTKYRKFLRGLGNPTPKPSSSASPTAAAAGAPSQDAGTLTTPAASDGPGAGEPTRKRARADADDAVLEKPSLLPKTLPTLPGSTGKLRMSGPCPNARARVGPSAQIAVPALPSKAAATAARGTCIWQPNASCTGSMNLEEYLTNVGRLLSSGALVPGTVAGVSVPPGSPGCRLVAISSPRPSSLPGAVLSADASVSVVELVPSHGRFILGLADTAETLPVTQLAFRSTERWFNTETALEVLQCCGYNTDLAWEALLLRMLNRSTSQFNGMLSPKLLYQLALAVLRRGKRLSFIAASLRVPVKDLVSFYYLTRHAHVARCWPSGSSQLVEAGPPPARVCGLCATSSPRVIQCITVGCKDWACGDCLDAVASQPGWAAASKTPYWLCRRCQTMTFEDRCASLKLQLESAAEKVSVAAPTPLFQLKLTPVAPTPAPSSKPAIAASHSRAAVVSAQPTDISAVSLLQRVQEYFLDKPWKYQQLLSVLAAFKAGKTPLAAFSSQAHCILAGSPVLQEFVDFAGIRNV